MYKMIIADDEQMIREALCTMIDWDSLGVEVAGSCRNGLEVLDLVVDQSPDFILTDIKMPLLGGLELIEKIKQTDASVDFIILSGYKDFEYARQAMKYGVRHYLVKPLNENTLIAAVEELKSHARAERRYAAREAEDALPAERSELSTVEKIKKCVRANIANPQLSLKWIAQNALYMNADYLSRIFVGQTQERFSAFMNRVRMEKAKELLAVHGSGKIAWIAEQVGCGDNPRYFSQVFKKYEGVSPSEYLARREAQVQHGRTEK